VGQLATHSRRIYFEYEPSFLTRGLDLSPFHLPLKVGVQEQNRDLFEGLFGLFHDSLPDGWGRLLLDREMERQGVSRVLVTPLHRLACVGHRGMGALSYEPELRVEDREDAPIDLDRISKSATRLLAGNADDVFAELLSLGGSSGGARPKVLIGWRESDDHLVHGADALAPDHVPYIVKFRAQNDPKDIGRIELAYREMAIAAGLEVSPSRLFAGARGAAYFGTRRFDRTDTGGRVHVHSLGGILHASHHAPGSLSYEDLLRATHHLTRDHREVLRAFRLVTFNVFAHNRDDHVKNFAFMMRSDRTYRLTPAYDLTFSEGPGGEHWMSIAGEGRHPTREHLQTLAKRASIQDKVAGAIIDEVRGAVSDWKLYARAAGVSKSSLAKIAAALQYARTPLQ
jgi:serine/threonine-protein kinase HipA